MTTSFRIAIDSLAYGQAGIGRTPEGKVVFVPKTAPGDLVEVELTRETSSYSEGIVTSIIEPQRQPVLTPTPAVSVPGCI